ncbi:hypothetical protein L6164_002734 [Bauhinia variegata]|uniref:Uncharacterized protein n=1 Tax=Bauhinia variegata TaxID=167791 RepID=A0ACB9PZ94_BAUVA|nr:hypothetical protein L6164_002734 [Bauhinia variegata]
MDLVTSLLSEKCLDCVLKLPSRELSYLLCYKNKLKELNEKAEQLKGKEATEREKIEVAARRHGEVMIHEDVKLWLQKVDEIKEIPEVGGSTNTNLSKYEGLIPSLLGRHQRGRRAVKLAEDVDKLLNEKFGEVSYRPIIPEWIKSLFSEIGSEGLQSRVKTVEDIMTALEDSRIRTVGIWGQGGVGKTTIAKAIAQKALEKKLFKVVVMATVTRNIQIRKIQGQIADMLAMALEEETEIGRAGQLRERLKKDKENTLVILDDLWDGLDLNKLGIPVHDDDSSQKTMRNDSVFPGNKSENCGGCKILLTSRSKEVLSSQMNVRKNSLFSLDVLGEKESEIVFKKAAGLHDKNSQFDLLASNIATKCAGLPVALVTVGRILKGKSSSVWNNVLQQLERQEFTTVQESMEFPTKLSYEHLEKEELRAMFLLCAQMGNDSLILDLLKHCIGLGILEGAYTIREARVKLKVLIERLKDSSLVLNSYSYDRFTMHDIVRDSALSIAFKEQHVFYKRNVKLYDEWLDKDKLEKYTTISLHCCDIVGKLPESLNFPRLRLFCIENNDHSFRIPDKFFEGMTELRVLLLIGIDLSRIPSSIKCLKHLRMLCLEQCVIGDDLSLIGKLEKLRILSFSGSELKSFPFELGLEELQLLDISNCSRLRVNPCIVMACLNNLEELYMRNSLVEWEQVKSNASLSELSHLQKLKALDMHIPDLDALPKNVFFHVLDYYMITFGDFKMFLEEGFKMPDQYEESRTMALHLKEGNNIHSRKGIKLLFKTVENLFLGNLHGVENIFYELNLQGFPCLKHLYIANNNDIKYIINSMNLLYPQEVFTNLESLHLYKLKNLETICCSDLTNASFSNLKIVKIKMCHQLQSLFSFSTVKLLTHLEAIEVSKCENMEVIADIERQGCTEIEVVGKGDFPQLRHVILKALPKFSSFYSNGELLFDERVENNLESIEISSIKISQIWSNPHLSSNSKFESLLKLDVDNCPNLKYLLSFSMAKCLKNLKALKVSECHGMELLIQEDRTNETEVDIFPNLKEIKIIRMSNLTEIWHKPRNQVGSDSYRNLESVDIEFCNKLVTVFPHHMVAMLKKLESLVVAWSYSVEVIFDIGNNPPTDPAKDTCLRKLQLTFLLNLKHVWSSDPEGILNFKSLQDVMVYGCDKINNLFPFSVANGLKQLESLSILNCGGMEQIVGSENGSNANGVKFVFPNLTSVRFDGLRKLRSFYPGSHNIEWPQLKNFSLDNCENLLVFTEETSNQKRLPILSEQVIPNLQSLVLGNKEVDLLSRCIDNYHLNSLKALDVWQLTNPEFLFRLLHRTPNLEKLNLWDCDFKELLRPGMLTAMEKIGIVVQLKDFSLYEMSSLHDIGFEQDPSLFQMLQRLTVRDCNHLINLVLGTVCFNHLTYLKVGSCDGLINLMESSTAKSLSQLTTLEISHCRAMEEIVSKKERKDEREDKIAFHRLTTLNLHNLYNLTSFCSSECCSFMFPMLERLVVIQCPKMKIFTQGVLEVPKLQKVYFGEEKEGKWYWKDNLNETIQEVFLNVMSIEDLELSVYPHLEELWHGKVPIPEKCFTNLKNLTMVNCEFLSTAIPCYLLPYLTNLKKLIVRSCNSVETVFDIGDIKTEEIHLERMTLENLPNLKNIFFEHSGCLKLFNGPQLEQWRHVEVRQLENYFGNLTTLKVERCDFISNVIPCNVVPCLKNLENLKVSSCRSVEKIFDVNDELLTSETKGLAFPLKYLTLDNLPALKNVWNLVKISQGIFSIPNLERVSIKSCQSLNFLFPASLAENLENLRCISIENCEEMEEIVGKDETAAEGEFPKFKFPCLTELTLKGLFKLKCFYPEKHNLECPKLESFQVFHCGMLDIFTQELRSIPKDDDGSSSNGGSLYSLHHEVIPKQEHLTLNPRDIIMLSCGEFQESLHNIKRLKLQCFHNVNEGDTLPYGFLNNIPNIEALEMFCSGFNMIFPSQRPEVDENRILTQIRKLVLEMLPGLKRIGLGHSWIDPLCSNLQVLEVRRCNLLTTLVQSTVSFCNLKKLSIVSCHGLEYLFTSSTAKSLVQLEEMFINSSKSIKGIVAKEEDESSFHEIIFRNLRKLKLLCLSSLLRFYTGNTTLNFPSLETVCIRECPNMEIFSMGIINAPKLNQIEVLYRPNYDFRWDTDLNTTIVKLLNEKVYLEQCKYLKLSDYPEAEKAWHGKVPLPKACFGKLQTLVVENCDFLSNVIPSLLLPYLKNLKKLQVKNCIYTEVIFDLNDMNMATNEEVSFSLEILTLDQLPNLKHVWSKDPEGIISFINLQEVQVTNCERLKALFTASLPKNLGKLKNLRMESCNSMEEIVGKDEANAESSTIEFVFPWLTSLVLSENPELKFFYAGKHNLICRNLKYLRVYHCGKLEMFTMNFQNYQEGQAKDHQGGTSVDAESFFSIQKVLPKLEEVSLNEKEVMMLWHEKSEEALFHNLKCLQLYCFHNVNESDTLPFGFLLKVPNMKTLAIACSEFKEIFSSQRLEDELIRKLAQLKELRLVSLSQLSSIGLEHSWQDRLCENLEVLQIQRCCRLTNIVQSAVSFSSLKELLINQCYGLECLFTSSTAKSLVRLKEMCIEKCGSIKEIVANEKDESSQDEIIFGQLKKLSLNSLPCLTSFHVGNSSLKLPYLHKVIITQCPKMKIFSQGSIYAPVLMGIQVSQDEYVVYDEFDNAKFVDYNLHWANNLNSTIEQLFHEKDAVLSKEKLI